MLYRTKREGEAEIKELPEQFKTVVPEYVPFPEMTGAGFKSIKFKKSKPVDVPGVDYTPIDVKKWQEEYGPVVTEAIIKNFEETRRRAMAGAKESADAYIGTELEGLREYAPAAAAIGREQISIDNIFNQAERLKQIKSGLPGTKEALDRQAERAEAYASGRVPDELQDRMLELNTRSAAADIAGAGGFGATSSAARKTTDLMSAEKRLGLSQFGESLLAQNIRQKEELLLAPTQYSTAGAQIRAMPTLSKGQVLMSEVAALGSELSSNLNQNIISSAAGLQIAAQQKEFGANLQWDINRTRASLLQNNRQFNASLRQQTRQFNSQGALQASIANAQMANNMKLAEFQYNVGYAGAVAGAANQDRQIAFELWQQEQYGSIYQDQLRKTQQANQWQSVAQGVTAFTGAVGAMNDLMGSNTNTASPMSVDTTGGAQVPGITPTTTGVTGAPGGMQVTTPTTTVQVGTPAPVAEGGQGDRYTPQIESPVSAQPEMEGPSAEYVPSPYAPSAEEYVPMDPYERKATLMTARFADNTGINIEQASPQLRSAMLAGSQSQLQVAGVSNEARPGWRDAGVDANGDKIYIDGNLTGSEDTGLGSQFVGTVRDAMDPLGAFTDEDATTLDKVGAVSSDVSFIATLDTLAANGDEKGFMNAMAGKFGPSIIKNSDFSSQTKGDVTAAFDAYRIAASWSKMSGAQKGLALASFGVKNYKIKGADGKEMSLADAEIPNTKIEGGPSLTVGQALNLLSAGINAYSLVKNWGQLNTMQRVIYGTATASNLVKVAKDMNLLGNGIQGAELANVTPEILTEAGFVPAPHIGVGAIVGETSKTLPQGYQVVYETDGVCIASPPGSMDTVTGALSGDIGLTNVGGTAAGGTAAGGTAAGGTAAGGTTGTPPPGGAAATPPAEGLSPTRAMSAAAMVINTYSAIDAFKSGDETQGGVGAVGAAGAAYDVYAGGGSTQGSGVGLIGQGCLTIYRGWGKGGKEGRTNGAIGGSMLCAGGYLVGGGWGAVAGGIAGIIGFAGNANKSGKHNDQNLRDDVRSNLKEIGVIDSGYNVELADGTRVNVGHDGHTGDRPNVKGETIHAYELDYENPLDFAAGMTGVALNRILCGGKNRAVDQLGGQLANASLANVGAHAEMTPENYEKMIGNMRTIYAKSGVTDKAAAYQLANLAYSEGRIDEFDLLQAHQSFNMIFDNDTYTGAVNLMGGRTRAMEIVRQDVDLNEISTVGLGSRDKSNLKAYGKLPSTNTVDTADFSNYSKQQITILTPEQAKYNNSRRFAANA